ncbi:hypothetical protein [Caulobacter sp.]|uniref:hypothetical protein n=1 Tax=Caulobacter sp. TaxID=78 RepID=UPI0031E43E09
MAARSQAAALEAWGTRQNLFAEGKAAVTDDADAIAAAMAHAGIPLRRAVGSRDPFSLAPGLPDVPDDPRRKTPALKVVARTREPPADRARDVAPKPRPPDRSALNAAQARLAAINAQRLDEVARLAERRAALDTEDAAARRRWIAERKAAQAAVAQAQRAFRAAGGEP